MRKNVLSTKDISRSPSSIMRGEDDIKTHGEIESAVCEAVSRFEQDYGIIPLTKQVTQTGA